MTLGWWNIRANQEDRELLESLGIKPGHYYEGRFMECALPEDWDMEAGNTPLDLYWGRFTWSPSQVIDSRHTITQGDIDLLITNTKAEVERKRSILNDFPNVASLRISLATTEERLRTLERLRDVAPFANIPSPPKENATSGDYAGSMWKPIKERSEP
jgi:hypothetical protein